MIRKGHPLTWLRLPGAVSLMHVEDLARALVFLAGEPAALGETYFAAEGQARTIGEIFEHLAAFVGKRGGFVPFPERCAGWLSSLRPRMPFAAQLLLFPLLSADGAKLEKLGFRSRRNFFEGVADLVRSERAPAKGERPWVITGAASGIGRALALHGFARGIPMVLVDRDRDGLQNIAEVVGALPLAADLAAPDELARFQSELSAMSPAPQVVINCAGVGVRGKSWEIDSAAVARLIAVNLQALEQTSRVAARRMVESGSGTIVNVASSASFQPLPGMAHYAASKAFVLSFTEALSEELRAVSKVRALAVCPGGTDSGFQAASGVRQNPDEKLLDPHHVAGAIFRAIDSGHAGPVIMIGSRTVAMSLLARVLPRTSLVRLWGRLMNQMR
jgi:short-subunit dehydrogenase